jgi:protoporphyrinogen/coproporphyrinogen III oxidase
LGGVLETIYQDDWLIERSADNFATLIPDARELSEACGLADTLIQPNQQDRQAFVYISKKCHPIPAGFSLMQPTRVLPILISGALSWRGKLRLLGEYWVAARPRENSQSASTDNFDESLKSFALRRLGQEAYERLVEPIVGGIFTADPNTLSMAATMPQFLAMEINCGGLIRGYLQSKRQDAASAARRASGARYDQFMAPRRGMSDWINSLAARLPANCVQLRQPVNSLRQATLGGDRTWIATTNDGSQFQADAVIIATPAQATARLLTEAAPAAALLVGGIPYASSAVVAMIIDRKELKGRLDGFGIVIPSIEQRQALAISMTSNKYPGRTPQDQVLLRVFLGGAMHPEIMDLADAELSTIAAQEVQDIMGWTGQGLQWKAVIRWNQAMPQYLVGHVARLQQIEKLLAPLRSIQLCGAAYQGVGIPQCIRSGRQAARRILEVLR